MITVYKPSAGLNLFSSGSNGDLYQRTNLKLQSTSGNGWLGASGPVTYSVTITNFPNGAVYPGYQDTSLSPMGILRAGRQPPTT